ncbi:hypothetical protein R3P38DRAFT_3232933, partial [Favolaschia claudopus]
MPPRKASPAPSTASATTTRRTARSTAGTHPARGKAKGGKRGRGTTKGGPGRNSTSNSAELLDTHPLAKYWAPFDNDDARALVPFFEDPAHASPDEEQLEAVERLIPVFLEYRQNFDAIPESVEVFLITISDVFKGIAKTVPGQTALIPAYRVLRPSQERIDELGTDRDHLDLLPNDFKIPRIVAAPEYEVTDDELVAPPSKKAKTKEKEKETQPVEDLFTPSPEPEPAPEPEQEPAPSSPAPAPITTRAQLLEHYRSLPPDGTAVPPAALIQIPTALVQSVTAGPWFSPEIFPCATCASRTQACVRAPGSEVCNFCADRHHVCSYKCSPAQLRTLFEHLLPYWNVSPHRLAQQLSTLLTDTHELMIQGALYARALNRFHCGHRDGAYLFKLMDEGLEGESDAQAIRGLYNTVFQSSDVVDAELIMLDNNPTSAAIPQVDAAGKTTGHVYQPWISNRFTPGPAMRDFIHTPPAPPSTDGRLIASSSKAPAAGGSSAAETPGPSP